MVRRKVYLEGTHSNVGGNHLISAEDVGKSSGIMGSEFETVLLSDVFEIIHDSTRNFVNIVKKEPLTVLVVWFSV